MNVKNHAWLVRPFPHGISRIDLFRSDNFVAIGWPGIGDLTGKSREELKRILSQEPYKLSGLALGNAYATVDIFVNQMDIGDYILVPDGDDIYFGQIVSDYHFEPNADSDDLGYSHQRRVEWSTNTSRKNLSMDLRKSLKVQRTTADLSHHYEEIQTLAAGLIYEPQSLKTITVSYPLRADHIISFEIPEDITQDEAQRLSDYMNTLYFVKNK